MKDDKTHINIRLTPTVRKAFRIHCAKKGVTAQRFIEDFIAKAIEPELKEMEEVN